MPSETLRYQSLLRAEFASIPIAQWGYFFPCHVAAWRYIEESFSGILGTLSAGFDTEPWFKGRGTTWFCDVLGNNPAYQAGVEGISFFVVENVSSGMRSRGFLEPSEVPEFPAELLSRVLEVIEDEIFRLHPANARD